MLIYGVSYGLHGYIMQDDNRWLRGMIQVTGYTSVQCIYYQKATDGISRSFGHTFFPYTGFHIHLSLLLLGPLFICIFLSTGIQVLPIFRARLLKSLWEFRPWIPCKKLHRLNYSLRLFEAIGP